MSTGVEGPTVETVLGVKLRPRSGRVAATPKQVMDLRKVLEVPSMWREKGTPCDGYRGECWPGRKVDLAVDTAQHRPRERARKYAYVVLSIQRELGLTPVTLQHESCMKFDPDTLADTLRGFEFGSAKQRRKYLVALVRVALERGYTLAEVIDWLAGWGAPVRSRDPVLFLGLNGIPQDHLPAEKPLVESLEQLWPRDHRGCVLPAAQRQAIKAKARAAAIARATRARTEAQAPAATDRQRRSA